MIKVYGIISRINSDGTNTSGNIKWYSTYQEMIEDTNPGVYGIAEDTGYAYHRVGDTWVIGFPSMVIDDDYTSFEVYPNAETIVAGTIDESLTELDGEGNEITYAYTQDVAPQMTHKFKVRTTAPLKLMDVIIDWGDGSISDIKKGDYIVEESTQFSYAVAHTYTKTGKYIVKIYGKQYFAISHSYVENNLISRVLDNDLPIASHLTNLSSFSCNADRLLKVDNPFSKNLFRVINTSSMFARCHNLLKCTGFGYYLSPAFSSCSWMFNDCWAMRETDFFLPGYFNDAWGIKGVFCNNYALAVDINTLLPPQGFSAKNPERTQLFYNCPLTGTVPANKLWNDPEIEWKGSANTFTGCPAELRAQVPTSWGGTSNTIVPVKHYVEQIAEFEQRIAALEAN